MKVGTDGVLLGAWGDVSGIRSVLDIGTGTGLIALMMAQRLSSSEEEFRIDAVEIDPEAAAQAQENVNNSRWSDSVHIHATSLEAFTTTANYDLIISNPPFYNATLKPEDEARAVARHKDSLPLSHITDFARTHLSTSGELRLIYPTSYDSEVMTSALLSGLHPITLCDVLTKKGKPCKRRMATFALPTHPQKEVERQILMIRDEEGNYSREYSEMVSEFYLRLN